MENINNTNSGSNNNQNQQNEEENEEQAALIAQQELILEYETAYIIVKIYFTQILKEMNTT